MRKELRALHEAQNHKSRYRFQATVETRSAVARPSGYFDTICLLDVMCEGELLAPHLWVSAPRIALRQGERIDFQASVREYSRRHSGARDYTLAGLRDVRVLATTKESDV